MRKQTSGFTIIELMIAVAIIGVLAALAIPAYQNYIKKAKVSEAFQMMAPYKISIIECLQTNGGVKTECNPGQYSIPSTQDGAFGKIITIENGKITYEFTDENTRDDLKGGKITLSPTELSGGTYTWSCTIDGNRIKKDITPLALNCAIGEAP